MCDLLLFYHWCYKTSNETQIRLFAPSCLLILYPTEAYSFFAAATVNIFTCVKYHLYFLSDYDTVHEIGYSLTPGCCNMNAAILEL